MVFGLLPSAGPQWQPKSVSDSHNLRSIHRISGPLLSAEQRQEKPVDHPIGSYRRDTEDVTKDSRPLVSTTDQRIVLNDGQNEQQFVNKSPLKVDVSIKVIPKPKTKKIRPSINQN